MARTESAALFFLQMRVSRNHRVDVFSFAQCDDCVIWKISDERLGFSLIFLFSFA